MKSPAKLLKATASAFGLARKTTDVEAIEAATADARAMFADGEREMGEAQARYRDALLSDDGDPAVALAEIQAAKIKRDRGEAQMAELTARLTAVREAAEQDRRRRIYEGAQAKAAAARTALLQDYPAIGRQVHALLRTLAEAEIAVMEANTVLPSGVVAIDSPEAQVRNSAWMPLEEAASEVLELWALVGGGDPLPAEDQGKVRRMPGPLPWKGTLNRDGAHIECHLRSFRRTVVREMPQDQDAANLAGGISLPALHPFTMPLWRADLGVYNTVNKRSPEATLAALAEVEPLNAAVWHRPEPADYRETVRYEEVGRPVELEAQPGAAPTAYTTGVPRFTPRLAFGDSAAGAFGGRR